MVEVISLEATRREFWDAWNGLSEVHTQEELEAQSERMWATKQRLWKVDPEFRSMIKSREDKAKAETEESRREILSRHKAIMSKAEAEVSVTKMTVRAVKGMSDENLNECFQSHRFKTQTPEEANTKSKLVCPICHGTDKGNLVNDEPTCIPCMHITVTEEELKNYNRTYRRRWKRKRRKH